MTRNTHPHRVAGAAIAAVLAFGSTPLFAQDIVLDAPPPSPAAAPVAQPTIVLPTVTAAPAEPVAAPVAEPVVAAPQREATTPRAAAPRAAAPIRTAVAPTVTPAALTIAPVAEAPTAPTPATDQIAAEPTTQTAVATPTETAAEAAPAENGTSDLLPIVGILAALGLGGLALFATRRRRRDADDVEPVIVAHEPVPARPVASIPVAPTPVTSSTIAPAPIRLQQSVQQSRPMWQEPRRAAATSANAQQSFDNRQALLDRMVAAAPDANNPFTSGKARRRRARLMLQSMDNQRWDDAQLEPGFDWREQARATRERETVSA